MALELKKGVKLTEEELASLEENSFAAPEIREQRKDREEMLVALNKRIAQEKSEEESNATPNAPEDEIEEAEELSPEQEVAEQLAEIKKRRMAELDNPKITVEDYLRAHGLSGDEKQFSEQEKAKMIKEGEIEAKLAFRLFRGVVDEYHFSPVHPKMRTKETDKKAKEKATLDTSSWKSVFDRINAKYDQELSKLNIERPQKQGQTNGPESFGEKTKKEIAIRLRALNRLMDKKIRDGKVDQLINTPLAFFENELTEEKAALESLTRKKVSAGKIDKIKDEIRILEEVISDLKNHVNTERIRTGEFAKIPAVIPEPQPEKMAEVTEVAKKPETPASAEDVFGIDGTTPDLKPTTDDIFTPPNIENKKPPLPNKEMVDFINEFNLLALLPEEFENLNENQKLKVISDLKKRIVDIVKSDAETQYSKDFAKKGFFKRIAGSITKERNLKNQEKKVFEEFKKSDEGRKIIEQDLEILTKRMQGQKVEENGSIIFLDQTIATTPKESEDIARFNIRANEFTKIPYEWGQEKSGKHKKAYEKARAEYEKAKSEILDIKTKNKPLLLKETLEIDNGIRWEQLLNTHPEFEQVLIDFGESAKGLELTKSGKKFLESVTLERAGLFAGGAGARYGTKTLAVLAGSAAGTITAIAAPAIGGAVGYWRGKMRAKETLTENQKNARHGQKDKSKEKLAMADASHLTKRLEVIMGKIENARNAEEHGKALAMLATRIEHTRGKIEKAQVNFGDSKSALMNQFDLVNSLNEALVLKEMMSGRINTKIKKEIDGLLKIKGENISKNVTEAQKAFIRKQAWKGAAFGVGFAAAGYAVRWAIEQGGWWHGPTSNEGETLKSLHKANIKLHDAHLNETQLKTALENAKAHVASTPEVSTPAITHIQEIKFEHGRGGIEGIVKLKEQISAAYGKDLSKAPQSVQEFMKEPSAVKQAIKLGLYNPNALDGKESALIQEGAVLKFDDHGNLLFGKPDASGNIPVLEKYHGAMLDSDHSGPLHQPEIDKVPDAQPASVETPVPQTEIPHTEVNEDVIREKLHKLYNPNDAWRNPVEPPNEPKITHLKDQPQAYNPDVAPEKPISTVQRTSRYLRGPVDWGQNKVPDAMQEDIKYIFKHDSMEHWQNLKNDNAKFIMAQPTTGVSAGVKDLKDYLVLLRNFSKIEPKKGFLFFSKPESTEKYIRRVLGELDKQGRLDEFDDPTSGISRK